MPVSYRFFELVARNRAKSPQCIHFIFSILFSRLFIRFRYNISSGATGSSVSSHFFKESFEEKAIFSLSHDFSRSVRPISNASELSNGDSLLKISRLKNEKICIFLTVNEIK